MSASKQTRDERIERARRLKEHNKTKQLLVNATKAVIMLSTHLKESGNLTQFYGAKRALQELWAIK